MIFFKLANIIIFQRFQIFLLCCDDSFQVSFSGNAAVLVCFLAGVQRPNSLICCFPPKICIVCGPLCLHASPISSPISLLAFVFCFGGTKNFLKLRRARMSVVLFFSTSYFLSLALLSYDLFLLWLYVFLAFVFCCLKILIRFDDDVRPKHRKNKKKNWK